MHIAIVLFDGVEELDWVGPWEVFAMWRALARRAGRADVSVRSVADSLDPITNAKGVRVLPDVTFDELADERGGPDLVSIPGGRGTRSLVEDKQLLGRLRSWNDAGIQLASVCTGSLLLAAAGLLEGRPATTHHGALGELAGLDGTCRVVENVRWVDDGDILTAAGVSAGIDLALHIVDRAAGTEMARAVRRAMQYDPTPPV